MKHIITFFLLFTTVFFNSLLAQNPQELWADFDPDAGDFKEEIIDENTIGGIYEKKSYISAYFKGKEIRIYCEFKKKADATNAPALLDVHGWMSRPNPDNSFVEDGWAVLAHDYCGKKKENNSEELRANYTKYPEGLEYGNMEPEYGYANRKSKDKEGNQLSDPTETDDYLWYVLQRRALSYLLAQEGVDNTRVGAKGYSYGGTTMWNLGMDERVDAIVAYFGVGFLEYYRTRSVFLYNNPYVEPEMTSGEEMYVANIAPQAHAPYIKAATLWLNGSNDHHGGHERGETIFHNFQPDVPWNFAIQPKAFHSTSELGDDAKIWLEKHVLGTDHYFPSRPTSNISLNDEGIPFYTLTPADPEKVEKVEILYALKDPNNNSRNWKDTEAIRIGNQWTATLPVSDIDDYVFAFSKIDYEGNVVISGDFEAEIPADLGDAVATLEPEPVDPLKWENAGGAIQVPGGVEAFYPVENKAISNDIYTESFYKSPKNSSFSIQYYGTQPQKLFVRVNGKYTVNVETGAHNDDIQEIIIPASSLRNINNAFDLMGSWSEADFIEIGPQAGQDITKVAFTGMMWVKNNEEEDFQPIYHFDGTENRIIAQELNVITELLTNPFENATIGDAQVTKVTRQAGENASILLPLEGEIFIGDQPQIKVLVNQTSGQLPSNNELTLTLRNESTGVIVSKTLPIEQQDQWVEYLFDFENEINSDGSSTANRVYSEISLNFGTDTDNVNDVVYHVFNLVGPKVDFEGTNTRLKEIIVNEKHIKDFDPTYSKMTIDLPYGTKTVPSVMVITEDNEATYEIIDATNIYEETVVRVTAKNGYTQKDYKVRFNVPGRDIYNFNDVVDGITENDEIKLRLVTTEVTVVDNPFPDDMVGEGVQVAKVFRKPGNGGTVEFMFKKGNWKPGEDKLFRIKVYQESGQEAYPTYNRMQFYADGEVNGKGHRGTVKEIEEQDKWVEYVFDLSNINQEFPEDGEYSKITVYFGGDALDPGTDFYFTGLEGPNMNYKDDATLNSISVDGKLLENFTPNQLEYTIELPFGTTGQLPTIEVEATNREAGVDISSITDFTEEQTITVTAVNGSTRIYKINYIEEVFSTNALLSELTLDNALISDFDADQLEYTYELPYGSTSSDIPVIGVITADEKATFVLNDASSLPGEATITVTAQDDTYEKVYKIMFTVAPNTDASLSDLTYNEVSVSEFSSSTFNYSIELPYGTSEYPNVVGEVNDQNAIVSTTYDESFPGNAIVNVVAEDGETTLNYVVTFTVASNTDATLIGLSYDDIMVENFSSNTFEYDILLAHDYEELPALKATLSDENATVSILDIVELPGSATVTVTAEDGETVLVYTVNFNQEEAPYISNNDATLSTLRYDNVEVLGFSSSTFEYDITLPYNYEGVPTLEGLSVDENAIVVISDVEELPGSAMVTVTAEDGLTVLKYTVNFTKEEQPLSAIDSLSILNVYKSSPNTLTVSSESILTGKMLVIFDLNGKKVGEHQLIGHQQQIKISTRGLMIIHIYDNNESSIHKVIF
ncbi:prolyl oligopeptidase family serine peptidase [Flammeovirga agarivorans]|uniref:Prolyl oligopeptidase family serine peptidase n=1 Tax=Flammeovirga agarivorans TaxID=2726742 RepID=A0A7X8SMD6_9BACT|nr:prolyl oligopeptidase family serine peptidase [Flammeovirga agarivorans]NLR92817.1 prolyl oligopeptidase family serine peptidase [Flammeovirga agarivorans]